MLSSSSYTFENQDGWMRGQEIRIPLDPPHHRRRLNAPHQHGARRRQVVVGISVTFSSVVCLRCARTLEDLAVDVRAPQVGRPPRGATVQPPRTRWTQGCLRGAQGVAAERGPFRPPQRLPGMQEIEPTSDACPMTRAVRNNWLPVRVLGTAVRNVAPIRPYRGAAGWPFVSGLIACRSRFAARGGGDPPDGLLPSASAEKAPLTFCALPASH
ncbi:hypothetical protein MRX96_006599 [Rhipicephalus microplus]